MYAPVDQPLVANSKTSAPQDEQILAHLRRGHFAAMEQLVRRYQDRLYATVFRIVNHPDDAADIVQETFVKALENVAAFEGKSSLYTWLFRIAVNLALTQKRRLKYRQAASLDADELNRQAAGLRAQLAQRTEPGPAEEAANRLDAQALLEALERLEPAQRALIVLRDIDGCDYQQIAEILQTPVGTVKSGLFRARMALRQVVEHGATSGRAAGPNAPEEGARRR